MHACRKVRPSGPGSKGTDVRADAVETGGPRLCNMVAGKQDRSKATALRLSINERP